MTAAPVLIAVALEGVTRQGAREAAERELSQPIYAESRPPLIVRLAREVLDVLGGLFDRAAHVAPGGGVGLLLLLALAVLAVVAIRLRLGPLARSARVFGSPEQVPAVSTGEHRIAAENHAARGAWAEAVRERMRAVTRELEVRGVLDTRPGRTADEVARQGGRAVPEVATALTAAARVFDDIWYGGRSADADAYARVRDADDRVGAAQPTAGRTAAERTAAERPG